METVNDLKKYLKDVEKRHGKQTEVYILTEDGQKKHVLQQINYENGKPVLYLKAVSL